MFQFKEEFEREWVKVRLFGLRKIQCDINLLDVNVYVWCVTYKKKV